MSLISPGMSLRAHLSATGIDPQRAAFLTRSLQPGGAIVTVQNAMGSQDAESILAAHHGHVRYEEAFDSTTADAPGAVSPVAVEDGLRKRFPGREFGNDSRSPCW